MANELSFFLMVVFTLTLAKENIKFVKIWYQAMQNVPYFSY